MEQWATLDEIIAARTRIAESLVGWVQPAAHGIGLIPAGETPAAHHFPVANTENHILPGVISASVLGYRRGSCVLEVTRAQLEEIIRRLTPAEACLEVGHPNLWMWRDTFLPTLDANPDARLVAVYLDSPDADAAAPEMTAFLKALQSPSP
ncbi:hypothetical protein [Salinibacterium sp. ZJ70]|uniref:hypothetical protein n=1 Tax=Salinibacterium sp. ZJ70 TaxID=2708084 RepID=UPI001CD63F54|nr:hypothetical protein [Salinibacterium sp. ZJ70]